MTVEVVAGGHRHRLAVEREARAWRVDHAGTPLVASLAPAGGRWSLLLGAPGAASARSYEVSVERDRVVINGRAYSTRILRSAANGGGDRDDAQHTRGRHAVVTPMPGRVVRVLVAPGDAVSERQGLVVVEAMKMENEVRASHAGVVTEVRVTEGTPVEARAVLVVLGPPAEVAG